MCVCNDKTLLSWTSELTFIQAFVSLSTGVQLLAVPSWPSIALSHVMGQVSPVSELAAHVAPDDSDATLIHTVATGTATKFIA